MVRELITSNFIQIKMLVICIFYCTPLNSIVSYMQLRDEVSPLDFRKQP